jgi:hypothetical protein
VTGATAVAAPVVVSRPRAAARWFFVWMAAACALIAFVGFAPTYWLQLPAGTFVGSPLLHLHGLLFSAWTIFFLLQTVLAARGRIAHHRAWGLLGISLATAMVFVGLAVANHALATRLAAGGGDQARAFHIVTISMMVLFVIYFAGAIAYVAQPEIHKRLMVLATIAVLPPAVARLFFAVNVGIAAGLRPGVGPARTVESVMVSALVTDGLILAGIISDVRGRGRPHPVYVIGGVLILAVQFLRMPLSTTPGWYAVADFLARFGG